LSREEAHAHYDAILDEYRRDPTLPPFAVVGLRRGEDTALPLAGAGCSDGTGSPTHGTIAFSSRSPHHARAEAGYAACNRARRLELRKPSGATKQVPLTLTTATLDVIA